MLRAQSKAVLVSLLAVAAGPQAVPAATIPDLYVAQVPAAALSGPPLDEAFALALDQVLVKVTGQRALAADPARRRAVGPPAPLVRQYQPVAGGQVRVSFDPAALRRRLDAANLPVWADDRPVTLVILPAEPVSEAGDLVGTHRQLLLAAAAGRGIPVVLAPDPVPGARTAADPLLDPEPALRAAGAAVLLVGRPSATGGSALLRWTLAHGTDRWEWQGDAADGAHGLADRLAARYATVAATGRVLRLRVNGIDSFDAYGRLQNYLRGVGLIQNAELKEVSGGQLIYELTVRGGASQLSDAFALRRVLEPEADTPTGDLVYRLVPGGMAAGADGP